MFYGIVKTLTLQPQYSLVLSYVRALPGQSCRFHVEFIEENHRRFLFRMAIVQFINHQTVGPGYFRA